MTPLVGSVSSPERGAVAIFLGTVRNLHEGHVVTGLAYSAYEPMAEAECTKIVAEAESTWLVRVSVQHRLGQLVPGDVAVAVIAAAAHRAPAFEACRWVIEAIKQRVPIWKQERYDDGTVAWVDPTAKSGAR